LFFIHHAPVDTAKYEESARGETRVTKQTSKTKGNKELKHIKTRAVQRSMSLLGLTLSSGVKYAGFKIGSLLAGKEDSGERWDKFLAQQSHLLVDELGRLKGSIMKAGQMLSMYGEHFFPAEVNRILKSLQIQSRAVTWEEMHKVLRSQLGEEVLAELAIEPEAIAAASMGQVYRARLKSSGEVLAIKVQYPGVDKAIDSDLTTLKKILAIFQLLPNSQRFDELFKEIRMMLHFEADYRREAEMLERFRTLLADDERFIVPRLYPRYCSNRVLALSFEEGCAIDSAQVLALSQERRNRLGAAFMEMMFREIFAWRLVQTDPHFGNYKIRRGDGAGLKDRIVLFDFGSVREFPRRYIYPFAALVDAAIEGDEEAIVRQGIRLGFLRETDGQAAFALFKQLCLTAIEAYVPAHASPAMDGSEEGPNPYVWGQTDLIQRLTTLAKDAVFTFKLRPPPREALFIDRKMLGIYTIITTLGLRMGPHKLLKEYVREDRFL
jgi:predicted unusual protein kinase regulating ubiquinone biosynthesis (AarF/ABC1/UbiB family)